MTETVEVDGRSYGRVEKYQKHLRNGQKLLVTYYMLQENCANHMVVYAKHNVYFNRDVRDKPSASMCL